MNVASITSIQPGWDVVGSDGDKIGDVAEIGPNYLLVTKGIIFVTDLYIPTSAVDSVEDGKVYLNVPKDQIESLGWNEPPSGNWTSEAEGLPSAEGTTQQYAETDQAFATQSVGGTQYETQPTYDTAPTTEADSTRVQRVEEELQAQKTQAEVGEVVVSKDVVEEQQTLEVPVTREEVQIRSRVVDRPADASDATIGREETIRVPVREEQVQVGKEARVVEELEIDKVQTQETQQVSDTVRKEQFRVDEQGDVDTRRS